MAQETLEWSTIYTHFCDIILNGNVRNVQTESILRDKDVGERVQGP